MTTPTTTAAGRRPAVLGDLLPGTLARDLALVLGSALFVGLSAQISLPLPGTPVPVTGQTFAVLLSAAALGSLRSFAAMALYLAVGGAGVPWFSGGTAGWGGATFGYVIGFLLAGLVVGRLAERGADRSPIWTALAMALGTVTIYLIGVPWLMEYAELDLGKALAAGVYPFLVGDGIKIALAAGLLPSSWALAKKYGASQAATPPHDHPFLLSLSL